VFISSRDPKSIEAAALEIGAAGSSARDLSKAGDPEALVNEAVDRLGALDILVVNAGGPPPGVFETLPLDAWEKAFDLTLMSAVRLVHAALPHLKRSDQGRVVVVTSISVRQPIANLTLSNSLRAAVTGLAKSLSLELAADRITVNCLAPDAILTDRLRHLAGSEENLRRMAERAPMKRFGEPAEISRLVAYLASDDSSYSTGSEFVADGGLLSGPGY